MICIADPYSNVPYDILAIPSRPTNGGNAYFEELNIHTKKPFSYNLEHSRGNVPR